MLYDPQGSNGNGSILATLGQAKVTLNLAPRHKKEGATFDRFGVLSVAPGGNLVRLYLDDLQYTAGKRPSQNR